MFPNAPKHYQTHQNIALIAPVQSRVLCSNKMVPNASKQYKTHQIMSLGFNGMDLMPSFQKIPTGLRCKKFCINCTSSADLHRVSCKNEMVPNAPKHYETHQNMCLGFNGMDWIPLLPKILTRLRCTNLSSASFASSFME